MFLETLMFLIYLIVALFCIYLNKKNVGEGFDVVNIYIIIWLSMISLYKIRLINYYCIDIKTWMVLISSLILIEFGYLFGNKIQVVESNYETTKSYFDSMKKDDYKLKKCCIVFTAISTVGILPNTYMLINRYGMDFLSKTDIIYYDNLAGNGVETIPYIGYFSQAACILAAIYFGKYGFRLWMIAPIFFAVINILPTGSRGNLIVTALLFLIPILITKKTKSKMSKKKKILLLLAMFFILGVFYRLTVSRSQHLNSEIYTYMSPTMRSIAYNNPAIYKIYQYFTSTIGVLNAFLNDPEFFFGSNTFSIAYKFLDKLGLKLPYNKFLKFYEIPYPSNAGTWLRSLIMDFGVLGMLIIVFVFSAVVGHLKQLVARHSSNAEANVFLYTVMSTIFLMGFFTWYLKDGGMFILLLLYFPVKKYLSTDNQTKWSLRI